LEAFGRCAVLRDAFGGPLASTWLAVRQAERELFAGAAPESVAAASRWRY
jgi:hypothetical protein